MSKSASPQTEAQSNQVPPELRRFAQVHCTHVESITRFDEKHEDSGRGWRLVADMINFSELPHGYRLGMGHIEIGEDRYSVQIRET